MGGVVGFGRWVFCFLVGGLGGCDGGSDDFGSVLLLLMGDLEEK